MLTDEKLNLNYARYIERLKKYDCYSQSMIDDLGEKLQNASFALQESSGAAYQGSLLNVVLNSLCVMACHINEIAFGDNGKGKTMHPYLKVNLQMLMRVLLLQHIAKAEMFILQPNAWKLKNGYIYDFNPEMNTCLKCGERSIYLCMKYGITLTEEEYEAMRIIDREDKDITAFTSPLCQMVKMVNQLVAIELHQTYKANNLRKETIEK